MTTASRPTSVWPKVAAWIGLVLHLVVGVFPYLASGLMVPGWGLVVLWVVWAGLLVLAIRLLRMHSPWTLAVPAIAVAFWFLWLTIGESLFGWTA
jgi:hypothetical protein